MRSTRFLTAAVWLTAFGLGGVALADAITSPMNDRLDPAFDIGSVDVRTDGDFLHFRMTLRGNAGASLPPRTGQFEGSQMYAYIWPTSADSSAAGFPRGQGLLALALISHPDVVENVGGRQLSAEWHPHWMVLAPSMGCGPYGLRIMDGMAAAPGTRPLMTVPASLNSAMTGNMVDVRVPAAMLGDTNTLRFDGLTASLAASSGGPSPLVCVRPFDVASGRLVLQGRVTQTGQ